MGSRCQYKHHFPTCKTFILTIDWKLYLSICRDKTDPEVVYYKHQIAYTPRHSAGASLALENLFINASLHATGVSKRYIASENRPSNEMDGYIEYGLSLYRSFKIKKFTYNLRGDIINLGNKQYDIVKSYRCRVEAIN